MLTEGQQERPDEAILQDKRIKDSYVLESLGREDKYFASGFEVAPTRQLETVLLEPRGDFYLMGSQRWLCIGNEWYRMDLLCLRRRLQRLGLI